jgi:hypothetical protein
LNAAPGGSIARIESNFLMLFDAFILEIGYYKQKSEAISLLFPIVIDFFGRVSSS